MGTIIGMQTEYVGGKPGKAANEEINVIGRTYYFTALDGVPAHAVHPQLRRIHPMSLSRRFPYGQ